MRAPVAPEEIACLPYIGQICDLRRWVRRNDWGKVKEEYSWFTEEEIREICDAIVAGKEKIAQLKKEGKDPELVNLEQLGAYEYIVPGTQLCLRFELKDVTDVMLGMFIKGWLDFAREPYLGALRRFDFGKVAFEFDVIVEGQESYRLVYEKTGAKVYQGEEDVTEELIEPFYEYLDEVKPEDLDVYKQLQWKKKDEGKSKKKSSSKASSKAGDKKTDTKKGKATKGLPIN
jgi:CRISPR type IV-associated protein Csf2